MTDLLWANSGDSHSLGERAVWEEILPKELADMDLSCIKTGFGWVAAGQGAPVVFYLDDVQYEGKSGAAPATRRRRAPCR